MSSYGRRTKNPTTGQFEDALWLDDYFGRHNYAVIFQIDDPNWIGNKIDAVYDARDFKWEFED